MHAFFDKRRNKIDKYNEVWEKINVIKRINGVCIDNKRYLKSEENTNAKEGIQFSILVITIILYQYQ